MVMQHKISTWVWTFSNIMVLTWQQRGHKWWWKLLKKRKRSIEKIAALKALLWSITQVIWLRLRILKWRWGIVNWERYRLWRLLWSQGRSAAGEPCLTRPFGTDSSVPEKDNCPVDNPQPSLPILINATSTKQISGKSELASTGWHIKEVRIELVSVCTSDNRNVRAF